MRSSLSFATALLALLMPAGVQAQADPAGTVQTLDAGLIGIMKSGKAAGQRGRAAVIGPVIDRTFDIPLMTRLAVGTPWNGFAAADQQALVTAFRRLTVAQYAANFDGFSGQSFTINPNVEQRAGDRLVRTTLVSKGSSEPIAYRLRQSTGGWRIIDVIYRSISQLATRRSDFADALRSGGAKGLIRRLDELTAKASG